jgi:hypothetical protein
MVRWLKEHNVDVILVGLHYMKSLVKDPHYQAMRASLQHIANAENVPRIGRYEAMEVIARTCARTAAAIPAISARRSLPTTAWRSMSPARSPSACSPSCQALTHLESFRFR